MNDLDLLRRFRQDVGDPDEARRLAQAKLDALMAGSLERIAHRRPQKRGMVAALAAAAAIAVAIVAIPIVLPSGSPAGIDPAAASLLRRFSSLTLKEHAEPPLQPGQYLYERTRSSGLFAFVVMEPRTSFRYYVSDTEETWLGADGSGKTQGRTGEPVFLTAEDRRAAERFMSTGKDWPYGAGETYREWFPPGERTLYDYSGLPTDVETLKGMIERREIVGGPEGDWETFNLAADLLTGGYTPPKVRAALFDVMADVPGVELLGRSEDALGRIGVAVGYTHLDERQEVIFERDTGRVLERRWVSISGDVEPPAPEDIYVVCPSPCTASGQLAITGPPGTSSSVQTYEVYATVVQDIGDVPVR